MQHTLKTLAALTLVLVSSLTISAEAAGAPKGLAKCTSMVISSVQTEEAPAMIEACYDDATRASVLKCGTDKSCVRDVIGADDEAGF